MRIVYLGTPDLAVPPLEALLAAGHDVACVVTQPDRPSGRRRHLAPPAVKVAAIAHGLDVRQTDNVNDPAFVAGLAALEPEMIVVAAFGQKLRKALLALPPRDCINIHGSLLPRHRGAAPIAHAILTGDAETGVTIMKMAARMDAGDILSQQAIPIGPDETTGQLTTRIADLGAQLLVATIADLAAGRVHPIVQNHSQATFAPSLSKADGTLDWTRPAAYLARLVRAMSPWPGAFTFWTPLGKHPLRIVVHRAEANAEGQASSPGRVAWTDADCLAVETADGILRILTLQPAGKRSMPAADFLRGHPVSAGDYLKWEERVGG